MLGGRAGIERPTRAEKDRRDHDFHGVHQAEVGEAPEKFAAAKQPDVVAGLLFQHLDRGRQIITYDRESLVCGRIKRA